MSSLAASRSADLDEVYRSESHRLVALASFLLGSGSDAEDVVHDAFIALAGRARGTVVSPDRYLTTTVVNGCKRQLRVRGRVEPSDVIELPPSSDVRLVEFVDQLSRLSQKKRTAVVLRFWAGYDTNEIASYLGCRPGTVGSLIHRATKELKVLNQ